MNKVIELKKKPNADAEELCKEILERIQSGDITDICFSYVTKRGGISGDFSYGDNSITMWAALSYCERQFYIQNIGDSDE